MPEEQAFCVLGRIMYEYGLRELYKNNFEDLHCKFYQLERLLQVSPPASLKPSGKTSNLTKCHIMMVIVCVCCMRVCAHIISVYICRHLPVLYAP